MPSPANPITVVIPNYNGARSLEQTLDAVRMQSRQPESVIVVDNGSTDDSARMAEASGVTVIRHRRNRGYGAAANTGLRACRTPNIAVLNSDARPTSSWLESLGTDGPSSADTWAWGSILLTRDGRVESAGDYLHPFWYSGKAGMWGPLDAVRDDPFEVLAPPGAAPLMDAAVVRALGGWFEPYFLYYEDLDLAVRARLAGLRCWMVPKALVEHDLAGSSGGRPPWQNIARSSLWCSIRTNPDLSLDGLARLHMREFRAARRSHTRGAWLKGKALALPAVPLRFVERRKIMRQATDKAWTPSPPAFERARAGGV